MPAARAKGTLPWLIEELYNKKKGYFSQRDAGKKLRWDDIWNMLRMQHGMQIVKPYGNVGGNIPSGVDSNGVCPLEWAVAVRI
jgi:hypothetical protein